MKGKVQISTVNLSWLLSQHFYGDMIIKLSRHPSLPFCFGLVNFLFLIFALYNVAFSFGLPKAILQLEDYSGFPFVALIPMPLLAHLWCVTISLEFVSYLDDIYEDNSN